MTFSEYSQLAEKAKIKLFFLDWRESDDVVVWINIYGTMLFSHDEEKRKMWISRSLLHVRFGAAGRDEEQCQDDIGNDLRLLSDYVGGTDKLFGFLCTKQINSIFSDERQRYKHGILAGLIFLEALRDNVSISKAIDQIYFGMPAEFEEAFGKYSQKHILDNIWPQYLPSVHLWASLISYLWHGAEHVDNAERIDLFCCPKLREKRGSDGIKGFILLAEDYLFDGLRSMPKRTGARKTLLDISKMVFIFHFHRKFSKLVSPSSISFITPPTNLLHVINVSVAPKFFGSKKMP
ncbi:MAG: hypothetical protein ACOY4F_14640 [Thermodesulfobacteriota bacterium]